MANTFQDFLSRKSVRPTKKLPLVHSTAAYHIKSIRNDNSIRPQYCDVFKADLSYFFVGRPAYKMVGETQAADWELPSCFIFEYEAVSKPTRIFPFDSGAFARGRMPSYIKMMKKESFEVSAIADASVRIIGAYFVNTEFYYRGKAKDEAAFRREFAPSAFDEEIMAVHRLSLETNNPTVDDRRLVVEVQSADILDLRVTKPIAVVAPLPYFEDPDFRDHVENFWQAEPISYRTAPLSVSNYYASIYERVEDLYKRLGVL